MDTSDITPADLMLLRKLRVLQSRIDQGYNRDNSTPYSYAQFCADLDVADDYVLRLLDLLVSETAAGAHARAVESQRRDAAVRGPPQRTPEVYPAAETTDPRAAPAQYPARVARHVERRAARGELDEEEQAYFLERSPGVVTECPASTGEISPLLAAAPGAQAERGKVGGGGKVGHGSSGRRVSEGQTRFEEVLDEDTDLSAISLDCEGNRSRSASGARKESCSSAGSPRGTAAASDAHALVARGSAAAVTVARAAASSSTYSLGPRSPGAVLTLSGAGALSPVAPFISRMTTTTTVTSLSSLSSPDLSPPSLRSVSPPDSPMITYYPSPAAAAAARPAPLASFLSQQHAGTGAQGPYAEPAPYHRRGLSTSSVSSSESLESSLRSSSISSLPVAQATRNGTRPQAPQGYPPAFGTSPGSSVSSATGTHVHPWIESNVYEQELVVSRRGSMWDAYDDPSLEGLVVQEINGVQLVDDV